MWAMKSKIIQSFGDLISMVVQGGHERECIARPKRGLIRPATQVRSACGSSFRRYLTIAQPHTGLPQPIWYAVSFVPLDSELIGASSGIRLHSHLLRGGWTAYARVELGVEGV